MIVRQPLRLPPPIERPRLADAVVVGDVVHGLQVRVMVEALSFLFEREDATTWTGGQASTLTRGIYVDEGYVTAARGVAFEAMRAEIVKQTGTGEPAVETLRCPHCARLLVSPELARSAARVQSVGCYPVHVVYFDNGTALSIPAGEPAEWGKA